MAIEVLRRYRPDSGGLDVWVSVDGVCDDTPIHFASGEEMQAVIERVVAQRQEARQVAAKLLKVEVARAIVMARLAGLFDEAQQAVLDHPNVTADQLKAAFVAQLKTWAAAWTGD